MQSCTTEHQYEEVLVSYARYLQAHSSVSIPAPPAYHPTFTTTTTASPAGCAGGSASAGTTYVTVPATQTVKSVPVAHTVQYAPVQTQYVQGGQAAAVGGCGH